MALGNHFPWRCLHFSTLYAMLKKPSYASVKAVISNADSYGADSEAIVYNLKNEKYQKKR